MAQGLPNYSKGFNLGYLIKFFEDFKFKSSPRFELINPGVKIPGDLKNIRIYQNMRKSFKHIKLED